MDHPLLLNETCLAALSSNYTDVTLLKPIAIQLCVYNALDYTKSSSGNSTDESDFCALLSLFFFIIVTLAISFAILICNNMVTKKIRDLRSLPSHQLHVAVEKEYAQRCVDSGPAREDFEADGRYVSVTKREDLLARRRTITIIEDMDCGPRGYHNDLERGARCDVVDPVVERRRRTDAEVIAMKEWLQTVTSGGTSQNLNQETEEQVPLRCEEGGPGYEDAASPPPYTKDQ